MPLQQTAIIYGDTFCPHYYLCNYLPVSAGTDPLSLSLLKFKRGRQPDLNAWIGCSLEILGNPTPSGNVLLPSNSILLRALHHDETSAREGNPGSLDKLGKALADHFHSHYFPRLLRKSLPTREIKGLSKEQREAELKNRYYIDTRYFPAPSRPAASISPLPGPPALTLPAPSPPSFLLIDDILTTGTTMKMIIGALLQPYPGASLAIFTLAKADYDSHGNRSTPLRGHGYPIGQDNNQTVVEEGTSTYSLSDYLYSLSELTTQIRSDTF
ncbi:MAG TPA: hypothetical protein VF939_02870 [Puia sp.]